VIINTTIPLGRVSNYPSRQVGKKALEFSKVSKAKIDIADGFVIPTETFRQIAHHNQLTEKIKLIEDTNDWSSELLEKKLKEKIAKLIEKQNFPDEVAKDIINTYHKFCPKGTFAKISVKELSLDNIAGEANLLESILEMWGTTSTKETLFTNPQLITTQIQPLSSGIVKPSREKKNLYVVKAAHGIFDKQLGVKNKPDIFEVDNSHGTIISRHLHPRKIELKRKLDGFKKVKSKKENLASLTDAQAIQIAKDTAKINRLFFGFRKISFAIDNKKIIVTKIEEITNETKQATDPILIGQSITGGYVEGYTQIIKNHHDKLSFTTGHILVKKTLTHLDLSLINQASAIILEDKRLTPAILKSITDNHIPCITGVIYATTRLHNNQKIVVDTGSGKIFTPTQAEPQLKSQKTLTKVFLSAGNPFKAEQYLDYTEGVFLKSDYAIAFMGVHPNHLLQNRKHTFEKNLSRTVQTFFTKDKQSLFYRSCNLNSHELLSLNSSLNYENEELNSYIGTRGALKTIQNPLLFRAELKVVSMVAHEKKREVNFVIPFVRTASELAIIFKIIEKTIPKNSYVKFWLQLNTPANIINLAEYLHLPIAGVTFQAKTIHDLTYGLDPDNPDLLSHYTFDSNLAISLLKETVQTVKKSRHLLKNSIGTLPVIVKLNQFDAQLVSSATKLGVRAIVVKPSLLDIVKQQIVATQNSMASAH
jgi:phosphoenolpyruvate synthase/pyruvate phosphate dikinase